MKYRDTRQQIVDFCIRLHQKNMLAAADGNVSVRVDEDHILITPSSRPKALIQAEEVALMNIKGEALEGRPSSEKLLHLEVYRSCPDAVSAVHAHPHHAIAWSLARPELDTLPSDTMSEIILSVGAIPFVPYARPGSQSMADHIRPFLPTHRVMVLRNHGALSWGESLEEAYMGIERLEQAAHVLFLAEQLGGAMPLPQEEVDQLKSLRRDKGPRTL